MSVINLPCDACETYTATVAVMLWDNSQQALCENCFTDKEEWVVEALPL